MIRALLLVCLLAPVARAERLVFEPGVSGGVTLARADRSVAVTATAEAGLRRAFGPVALAFGARVGVEALGAVDQAATLAPDVALRFLPPRWFPYLLASVVGVLGEDRRELDVHAAFGVEAAPGWFVELGYRHRVAGSDPVALSGLVAAVGFRVW